MPGALNTGQTRVNNLLPPRSLLHTRGGRREATTRTLPSSGDLDLSSVDWRVILRGQQFDDARGHGSCRGVLPQQGRWQRQTGALLEGAAQCDGHDGVDAGLDQRDARVDIACGQAQFMGHRLDDIGVTGPDHHVIGIRFTLHRQKRLGAALDELPQS